MSFDEYLYPCNQHLNQNIILCFSPVYSYHSIDNYWSDFYCYTLISPVLESLIHENMQWVLFCCTLFYSTQHNFSHKWLVFYILWWMILKTHTKSDWKVEFKTYNFVRIFYNGCTNYSLCNSLIIELMNT